jgi:teichuronic acid biosynthesis glycosyltransferase TuaC
MRILTVTRLFPNAVDPAFGTFILARVKAIVRAGHEVRVVAPVPYVPPGPVPERHRIWRFVPRVEEVEGCVVEHPRFVAFPKVGRAHARGYALGITPSVQRAVREFRPDVVDVHYLYPDACGVSRVVPRFALPYVCTARGSDVKYFGRREAFRVRMRRALAAAADVHAVSADLAGELAALGLFAGPVAVIRNGVDPDRFRPRSRKEARRHLGLPLAAGIAVCVAHLVPEHRHELLIRALGHPDARSDVHVYFVGHGHRKHRLVQLAASLKLRDRVHFVGPVPHAEVAWWLGAADVSALVSDRAGCPNVVLESSACGIPCLLSDIPAMREMIDLGHRGWLVPPDEGAVARGLTVAMASAQAGGDGPLRRTWDDVAAEVLNRFEGVLASARSPATRHAPTRTFQDECAG